MHGNNPTRDSIERALDFAVREGLIRSWKRLPAIGGGPKWEAEVNASVHSADGLGTYPIRTYQEGLLFCAALASARTGFLSKARRAAEHAAARALEGYRGADLDDEMMDAAVENLMAALSGQHAAEREASYEQPTGSDGVYADNH